MQVQAGNGANDSAYLYLLRQGSEEPSIASQSFAEEAEGSDEDDPESASSHSKLQQQQPSFYAMHGCTDVIFLLIFAVAVGYIAHIGVYAVLHGDYRRLFNGFDSEGKQCGIDIPGKNYLFWCRSMGLPGVIDVMHPVCVDRCPSSDDSTDTSSNCFEGALEPDYATTVFAARYCLPKDDVFLSQLENDLQGKPVARFISGISMLTWAWMPLLTAADAAVVLGFAHVSLLGRCTKAACECIADVPTLLLEPILTLCIKVLIFVPLISGFVLLLSTGDVEPHGTYRTFKYSHTQKVYIVTYFLAILWAWDLCNALSHFVLAYVVQRWYFTPYFVNKKRVDPAIIFDGYWLGVVFHLGTLSLGAAIIASVRALRICLAFMERQASYSGNCVAACLAKVCFACLTCMQRMVEFLNKNAYIEVAVSSAPFFVAAYRAGAVINREISAVAALNGACWILKVAGLGAIAGVGALVAWLTVRSAPDFSNIVSERYVHDPVLLAVVAGALCLAIAYTFLTVFDMACDTVLYCFATERQRQRVKLGAPEMMSSWRPLRRSRCAPASLHHFLENYSGDY
mmetsp:Transcript_1275/g.2753  ORF Transcript_1275/g.2753 Transcript_1275/m.2753 type:complete len:569 (+) Transcript_1275:71-1777(+)